MDFSQVNLLDLFFGEPALMYAQVVLFTVTIVSALRFARALRTPLAVSIAGAVVSLAGATLYLVPGALASKLVPETIASLIWNGAVCWAVAVIAVETALDGLSKFIVGRVVSLFGKAAQSQP